MPYSPAYVAYATGQAYSIHRSMPQAIGSAYKYQWLIIET